MKSYSYAAKESTAVPEGISTGPGGNGNETEKDRKKKKTPKEYTYQIVAGTAYPYVPYQVQVISSGGASDRQDGQLSAKFADGRGVPFSHSGGTWSGATRSYTCRVSGVNASEAGISYSYRSATDKVFHGTGGYDPGVVYPVLPQEIYEDTPFQFSAVYSATVGGASFGVSNPEWSGQWYLMIDGQWHPASLGRSGMTAIVLGGQNAEKAKLVITYAGNEYSAETSVHAQPGIDLSALIDAIYERALFKNSSATRLPSDSTLSTVRTAAVAAMVGYGTSYSTSDRTMTTYTSVTASAAIASVPVSGDEDDEQEWITDTYNVVRACRYYVPSYTILSQTAGAPISTSGSGTTKQSAIQNAIDSFQASYLIGDFSTYTGVRLWNGVTFRGGYAQRGAENWTASYDFGTNICKVSLSSNANFDFRLRQYFKVQKWNDLLPITRYVFFNCGFDVTENSNVSLDELVRKNSGTFTSSSIIEAPDPAPQFSDTDEHPWNSSGTSPVIEYGWRTDQTALIIADILFTHI